jgi:hypothetical protein
MLASNRDLKKSRRLKVEEGSLKKERSKVEDCVASNWLVKPHISLVFTYLKLAPGIVKTIYD